MDDSQRKNDLEEEMSRFEQEIAGHPIHRPIISANTFKMASQAIQEHVVHQPPLHHAPPMQRPPHPPHMPNVYHPRQHHPLPPPPPMPTMPMNVPPQRMQHMMHNAGPVPQGLRQPHMQHMMPMQGRMQQPLAGPSMPIGPMPGQMVGPMIPGASASMTITPAEQKEWESTYSQLEGEEKERKKKEKKFVRVAGGQVWEDSSLATWDSNDFRIFCGDLGSEVSDESLTRAFSKYTSFLKAKVVRDKKSQKSKGYGFISFKDPNDFIKAMREMNGKYIGSRPIKLRKSTWKDRSIDVVKKKVKEKKKLGLR